MRVEYFWLAGATVSAFAGAAARADEQPVTVLKPASEWNLNYAEDRCRLGRLFGGETDETIFWIEQSAPSASFSWLIAGGASIACDQRHGLRLLSVLASSHLMLNYQYRRTFAVQSSNWQAMERLFNLRAIIRNHPRMRALLRRPHNN